MTDLSQVLADSLNRLRPTDPATGRPISLAAWGDQLGVGRKPLERMLKNAHEPQLNTLELLAHHLRVSPLELIADESAPASIGMSQEIDLLSQLTEAEKAEVRGFMRGLLQARVASAPKRRSA